MLCPQVSWDLEGHPLDDSAAHTQQSLDAIISCECLFHLLWMLMWPALVFLSVLSRASRGLGFCPLMSAAHIAAHVRCLRLVRRTCMCALCRVFPPLRSAPCGITIFVRAAVKQGGVLRQDLSTPLNCRALHFFVTQ